MTGTEDARGRLLRLVVAPGLCARCGGCVGVCPARALESDDDSLPRPAEACTDCGRCLAVCPGRGIDLPAAHRAACGRELDPADPAGHRETTWLAQAVPAAVLGNCAGGGAGTALALALLRAGEVDGVGVVAADPARPWRVRPVLAREEDAIVAAGQSRYAFAPMLALLGEMARAGGRYALLTLPCQSMALHRARRAAPEAAERVRFTIGLFCHYNLPHEATEELLARVGVEPRRLSRLEYRGGPWPGGFRFTLEDGSVRELPPRLRKPALSFLYALHATERCLLCPDGFNLLADLALGDFWCRDYAGELARLERRTMVLVRTEAGRRAVEIAGRQGLLALAPLPEGASLGKMVGVAARKRELALALAARRRRRGVAAPDFGLGAAFAPGRSRVYERSPYHLLAWARRRPGARRLLLRLLFSRAGALAAAASALRRRLVRGAKDRRRGAGPRR